jgi:hypothetical protein
VNYDANIDAGGDFGSGFSIPAREFLIRGNLMPLAMSEPPPRADGGHYREMASKVRELARHTHSSGAGRAREALRPARRPF